MVPKVRVSSNNRNIPGAGITFAIIGDVSGTDNTAVEWGTSIFLTGYPIVFLAGSPNWCELMLSSGALGIKNRSSEVRSIARSGSCIGCSDNRLYWNSLCYILALRMKSGVPTGVENGNKGGNQPQNGIPVRSADRPVAPYPTLEARCP